MYRQFTVAVVLRTKELLPSYLFLLNPLCRWFPITRSYLGFIPIPEPVSPSSVLFQSVSVVRLLFHVPKHLRRKSLLLLLLLRQGFLSLFHPLFLPLSVGTHDQKIRSLRVVLLLTHRRWSPQHPTVRVPSSGLVTIHPKPSMEKREGFFDLPQPHPFLPCLIKSDLPRHFSQDNFFSPLHQILRNGKIST